MKTKQYKLNIFRVFLFILFIIIFSSCGDLQIDNSNKEKSNNFFKNASLTDERILFAMAFSSAIEENECLRAFLKNKILEYGVCENSILYHQIKDEIIEKDCSLRSLLVDCFEDENQLIELENQCPLLSIFIPELPEEKFSVETWNTSNQIPKIAVFDKMENVLRFYKRGCYDFDLKADFIPAFPVILIKDCDINEVINRETNGRKHKFTYGKKYDNIIQLEPEDNLRAYHSAPDAKVITAYGIYANTDGWQRDYIYYDISPNQTRGEFKYTHQETLTSFKLGSSNATDVTSIFRRISDSSEDPGYGGRSWADGSFIFQLKCKINSKTGIGNETKKIFMIKATQLYDVHYDDNGNYYSVSKMYAKTVNLSLNLFNWDLYDISPSVKISIEEVDPSETVTLLSSETTIFAGNFEITIPDSILKVGLKFGSSNTISQSVETQTVYSYDSDKLGDVVVNFADKIILNDNYDRRKYYNSSYTLNVEPKRVQ